MASTGFGAGAWGSYGSLGLEDGYGDVSERIGGSIRGVRFTWAGEDE